MNKLELKISAILENEQVARNAIAMFASNINCTLEDIIDIKTIVSEGVSNAIIHGYLNDSSKDVIISASLNNDTLNLIIQDFGVGIEDINKALSTNYSSTNRTGLGLSIIKSLSNEFEIKSKINVGTKLIIKKILAISK